MLRIHHRIEIVICRLFEHVPVLSDLEQLLRTAQIFLDSANFGNFGGVARKHNGLLTLHSTLGFFFRLDRIFVKSLLLIPHGIHYPLVSLLPCCVGLQVLHQLYCVEGPSVLQAPRWFFTHEWIVLVYFSPDYLLLPRERRLVLIIQLEQLV